jgi:hypothetical protein
VSKITGSSDLFPWPHYLQKLLTIEAPGRSADVDRPIPYIIVIISEVHLRADVALFSALHIACEVVGCTSVPLVGMEATFDVPARQRCYRIPTRASPS